MDFGVLDKVIHPIYGPGLITGVEDKEWMDGFEHYYVIDITEKRLTVRVPVRMVADIGLRPAMSSAKVLAVLDILRHAPSELPLDFKQRQSVVRAKLDRGNPRLVAEVVRDLYWHEQIHRLTKVDAELLERGKTLLASEMALVGGTPLEEASTRIQGALQAANGTKPYD